MLSKETLPETIKVMQNHVSVRSYTTEPIPKEHLLEIIRSGQSAPSSHFVQAFSIIHVTDNEKRNQIADFAKNKHIRDASDFFLFCGDFKRLEYASKKYGIPFEYDSLENFIVATIDPALVAQNILTAAESFGYGGCYIGGVRNNIEQISKVVGLPDKVFPLFGLCLGIPTVKNEVKPRLPMEAIIHENVYNEEKYPDLLDEYDQIMNDYYHKRSSNNKDTNWTEPIANYMKDRRREDIRAFFEDKGFHLR